MADLTGINGQREDFRVSGRQTSPANCLGRSPQASLNLDRLCRSDMLEAKFLRSRTRTQG